MQVISVMHEIQKEDLFLVIGTLQSPNYALFVSYSHLDGHAHFNIFTYLKKDWPWGSFMTGSLVLQGPCTWYMLTLLMSVQAKYLGFGVMCLRFKPNVLDLLPFNF
ncbi:hypothetical protein BDQ17DRAFT_1436517 [Cyathus striatus]|nr:hypothetical protein BDQ17DRAFT_1436517 [Cyathus striatus]